MAPTRVPGAGSSAHREHLEGELVGFTYQTDDGAFAVARLRVTPREGEKQRGERTAIVVGPIGHVTQGQHTLMSGKWVQHPNFGRQFKAVTVLVEDPRTLKGVERYLGSGAVEGLGPEFARRVVARFGLDTLRVIDEEPHRLTEVSGIGVKRMKSISEHWARDRKNRETHALLRGFGIGQALGNRIIERYGDRTVEVVRNTPYRLSAEIRGIGFRTADTIAQAVGIPKDSPQRAEAATLHVLREAEGQGHTCLPFNVLMKRIGALEVTHQASEAAISNLLSQDQLRQYQTVDPAVRPIYLSSMDWVESFVAQRLGEISATAPPPVSAPPLDKLSNQMDIQLSSEQQAAIQLALRFGVSVITGGPGTGKTTIMRVLLASARSAQESWALAAPTGRAAQRLGESTGAIAKTIHRTLEYNGRTGVFEKNHDNLLDVDGVLVDEASMVDTRLMAALLAAIPPRCRLVLVGDADQLPSVGAGQVLHDIIQSGEIPVATLHMVFRQAEGSEIIENAHAVNQGQIPVSHERSPNQHSGPGDFFVVSRENALEAQRTIIEIVTKRLPALGFDAMTDVQVLAPMHNGALGTVALNEKLQKALNPTGPSVTKGDQEFRLGDRVLQMRNDYDNDVFNGDVGRVVQVNDSDLVVDFNGREVHIVGERIRDLRLGYAVSVHKSQGSEYPAVVIALHSSHRIMLQRNLLYTGLTRASRFCCIVGNSWAIETAVKTQGVASGFQRDAKTGGNQHRWTRLQERLQRSAT